MRRALSSAAATAIFAMSGLSPTRTVSDTLPDFKDCEVKLKDLYTIRHTVVWPGNRIGGSVKGGGPSSADYTLHWPYAKSRIVTDSGLGDPRLQTIESTKTVDRDVTGDAWADATFSGDVITYSWHVYKDWFGSGATALARIEIVFRQADSDETIASIGRICAAKVLGRART